MADARRPPHSSRVDAKPARPTVDADGWNQVVRKRKRSGRPQPPPPPERPRKVPVHLIGLCFTCFSNDHVAHFCLNRSCCFRCREPGDRALDCSTPRVIPGSRSEGHRELARRTPPPLSSRGRSRPLPPRPATRARSPSSDRTPTQASGSTSGTFSSPSICAPPSVVLLSPPPLPSPLPVGAPERRSLVEQCIV
jgi:hypothetical protein